jgi:amino acid transporter
MLSLQHVGGERLAGSTIPHMTAAREILGQPGRLIMGVAVISSTCALVNMLFHMVTNTLAELAERNLLPGHPPGRLKRRRFVLVITLIISALLMGGLAGYEVLETYIQAALILWLLHTGCNCLAAGRILRQNATPGGLYGIALGLFYLLVSLYLAISAQDPTTLTRFLLIMLFTTAISSLLWLRKGPVVEVIQHNSQGDLS